MQQIFFILILGVVSFIGWKKYSRVFRIISLGKEEEINDRKAERFKNVLLVAFGQKKMFKRIIPAVMHLFIYVAFLFTQIELLEIIIDGVFGVHRFFADKIGFLYPLIINSIEILSVLAFIATVVFLWRRNLLKIPRFKKPEMKGWPTLDANYILIGEIILLIGIFSMNGSDAVLQKLDPEHFPSTGGLISSWLGTNLFSGLSQATLVGIERFGWWLHILTVFAFLLYLPISKHLHIILAFPNVFYARLKERGEINNMPEVMNEVKSMMGLTDDSDAAEMDPNAELPDFGSKDIFDLSWRNILNAYTCTECGRCSSVCPANETGKKLSPRKIMMDIRDRSEEVYAKMEAENISKEDYNDGKSLFDYISEEELYACTTCNACVEACPVMIDPLQPILELRRYKLLTEAKGPDEWLPMFTALENGGNVWQMPGQRADWTKSLNTES